MDESVNSPAKAKGLARYLGGKCVRCGRIRDCQLQNCPLCRKKDRERINKIRLRRIAKGVCIRCESPDLKSKTMCSRCLAKQKEGATCVGSFKKEQLFQTESNRTVSKGGVRVLREDS